MLLAPKPALKQFPATPIHRLMTDSGVDMSNFDYLMALNTIGGRGYNDLSQYPVMPWVLTQYTQETIDLSDPAVYRDLSKPIGALNEQRLLDFIERFKSFQDPDIPSFMYGSYYSTMVGVVLHYLVRLQPFASLHKNIQNGRCAYI